MYAKNVKVDFEYEIENIANLIHQLDWTENQSFITLDRMVDDMVKYHKYRVEELQKEIRELHKIIDEFNRPECCKQHDKWYSVCDICEFGGYECD